MNFFDFLAQTNSSGILLYAAIFASFIFILLMGGFLANKFGFKFKFLSKFFTITNEEEKPQQQQVVVKKNDLTTAPIVNNIYQSNSESKNNQQNNTCSVDIDINKLAALIKNYLIDDPFFRDIFTSTKNKASNQYLNEMAEKIFEESYQKQLEIKISKISEENTRLKQVIRDLNTKLAQSNSLNHDLIVSYEGSRAILYKKFMLFFKSIIINRSPSKVDDDQFVNYIEENLVNSIYEFYRNLNANTKEKYYVIWKNKEVYKNKLEAKFRNELEKDFLSVFEKIKEINIKYNEKFEKQTDALDIKLNTESHNLANSIHNNIFHNPEHKLSSQFIKHIVNNTNFYDIVWDNELFDKIVNNACIEMVHIFESVKRESIELQLSVIEHLFSSIYRRTELLIKEYVLSTIDYDNISDEN